MTDADPDRDECWFLMCRRDPAGVLYGEDGFAVAACEQHGVAGEAHGWERFDRYDTGDDR